MNKIIAKSGIYITILAILILLNIVVYAEPTIKNIDINPDNPEPLSTVSISCDVSSDEEIQEIKAIFEECKTGFCYTGEEVTLTLDSGSTYSGSSTLSYDDATSLKYHVEVKTGDIWTKSDTVEIDLKTSAGNGSNNNDNNDQTPGFSLIVMISALIVIFIIYNKKRLR